MNVREWALPIYTILMQLAAGSLLFLWILRAVKLIPTPRELSSDCGISLRFDWSLNGKVKTFLESAHVEIAGIHAPFGK